VQERLCQQIASEVARLSETADVAVALRGELLCIVMRGIRSSGLLASSIMRGAFREQAGLRQGA
jgi:GTP cyclohydrolase I